MSLYIERYRPKTREEISGNQKVIDDIFSLAKKGNLPHMIFEGKPGIGKTTTALVLARQMFGEFYRQNFLELNASDERGIDVVRNEVKSFCKTVPLSASLKICFLDEFDEMTKPAQDALRRIMEQYASVTRFVLGCNAVEKIIEPISSRCQTFHFSPLSEQDILTRLNQVVKLENLQVEAGSLEELAKQANGDMRKALNQLQVLASYGIVDKKGINIQSSQDNLVGVYNSLLSGRFLEARKQVKDLLLLGYTERDIINKLHNLYIDPLLSSISPTVKGECILALAETDYRLTLGISKGLQLDALMLRLLKIMKV